MDQKSCVTCHQLKPLHEYNVRQSAPDGRQPRCRDCCKRWYVDHRVAHIATARARKRHVRVLYQQLMGDYLRQHPCVDCGEDDIRVLEFDHRPGVHKVDAVANLMMTQVPWRRVLAEIEKCDVRCANCHRRLTAARGGHWRHLFVISAAAQQPADEPSAVSRCDEGG